MGVFNKTTNLKEPIKLNCQRCKYSWDYFGNNEYMATCPHCFTKVSINKQKKKNSSYAEVAGRRRLHIMKRQITTESESDHGQCRQSRN